MIRGLAALVLTILTCGAAAAQSVAVRSGEHPGFSRLVLQIPKGTAWSLNQTGRSAVLDVGLAEIRYDTAQVFDRIPRTRLAELRQSEPGGKLELRLGCDCGVSGHVQSQTLLVIDIRDRPGRPSHDVALPLPMGQVPYRFRLADTSRAEFSGHWQLRRSTTGDGATSRPLASDGGLPWSPALTDANRTLVELTERRLLAQIDRATDQGLLMLRDGAAALAPPDGSGPAPARPGVRVTTAIDRDMTSVHGGRSLDAAVTDCIAAERISLRDQDGNSTFGHRIAALRQTLFTEFDKLNPEAALDLARAYLHFGFGAEAGQALALLPASGGDLPYLTAMAQMLDYGQPIEPNPFLGLQGCDGDAALWAVLSQPVVPDGTNRQAVLRTFSALPMHLREHLGPLLSQRFAARSDIATADAILRVIERSGDTGNPALGRARAEITASHGETAAAARRMSDVAQSGTDEAPVAVVRAVELAWQSRTAIPPGLEELAAAYGFEYRDTPLGPELRRAQAIALALGGGFSDSVGVLDEIAEQDGEAAYESALEPVLTLLTENADDMAFLRIGLEVSAGAERHLSEDFANKMARRLLDLGFPDSARRLLGDVGTAAASPARRLLHAEVALALDLPHRAMVLLPGIDGPEADALRTAALIRIGDRRQAGELLLERDDRDEAAREFWHAGVLAAVPPEEDGRYARVAQTSSHLLQTNDQSAEQPPLGQARALVEDSAAARAGIAELLERVADISRGN